MADERPRFSARLRKGSWAKCQRMQLIRRHNQKVWQMTAVRKGEDGIVLSLEIKAVDIVF